MTELLVPYTDISTGDLAMQLHTAVDTSRSILSARNLRGPIARYGGNLDTARENVLKGANETRRGTLSHFAVMNASGNVVGSASIYPDLKLRKLHLPLPPAVAWADEFEFARPNIAAWTTVDESELLVAAYRRLAKETLIPVEGRKPHPSPWTLEPTSSPSFIHTALEMAGLERVAKRRFDDQESRKWVRRSVLYAKLTGKWFTARGMQRELRVGDSEGFVDEMDDLVGNRIPNK